MGVCAHPCLLGKVGWGVGVSGYGHGPIMRVSLIFYISMRFYKGTCMQPYVVSNFAFSTMATTRIPCLKDPDLLKEQADEKQNKRFSQKQDAPIYAGEL